MIRCYLCLAWRKRYLVGTNFFVHNNEPCIGYDHHHHHQLPRPPSTTLRPSIQTSLAEERLYGSKNPRVLIVSRSLRIRPRRCGHIYRYTPHPIRIPHVSFVLLLYRSSVSMTFRPCDIGAQAVKRPQTDLHHQPFFSGDSSAPLRPLISSCPYAGAS